MAKTAESVACSKAGVDSGEIIIRGGSHLDFSFIPNQAFGASLRGPDTIDWYTSAWFDKYLKPDPTADARLLTNRWREDAAEAGVDPNHDGNAFSFYYYSRLDVHLARGQAWDCEDLRDGCPGMTNADGYPGNYSYLAIDTSPDSVGGTGAGAVAGPSNGLSVCARHAAAKFHLHRFRGRPIVGVKVYVDGRLVVAHRGRSLRSVTLPGLPGVRHHVIRIDTYTSAGLARATVRGVTGCGRLSPPRAVRRQRGNRPATRRR